MKPTVFIVIGLAGSGKSSVSKALAVDRRAAYLDKDTLASGFISLVQDLRGADGDERENNDFYQTVIFPIEYATVLGACADNLRVGMSVVIDAPFSRYLGDADYIETVREQFGWPDCSVVVVRVRATKETIKRRVIARRNPRDAWKLSNWKEYWAMMGALECRWRGVIHVEWQNDRETIDTTELAALVDAALSKSA